jgi:hypothetical protein
LRKDAVSSILAARSSGTIKPSSVNTRAD